MYEDGIRYNGVDNNILAENLISYVKELVFS